MNILTEARRALLARLENITIENGYRTNAGHNVRSGWFNEVIKEVEVSYPLIVVQPAAGLQPSPGPNALKMGQGYRVVGAVSAGLEYEDDLDDLHLDLLQCLVPEVGRFPKWLPLGVTNIQIGAPDVYPPGDGVSAAAVLVPVHLNTIVEGIRK